MCGIVGAVGRIDATVSEAVVRMNLAEKHRGPDDEGAFSSVAAGSEGQGAAFAFRRLAIIDLSADGHQPMLDPDTGNVIVFNGEIYNYVELRRELEGLGVEFRSKSDTEVLLKLYGRYGADGVRRLRGMFAFAVWDPKRGQALIARDRLGIKPLYLATAARPSGGRTLLFSSEIRAMLESGLVARKLSPVGLASYVWNGFVYGPETIVDGIRMLPAGSLITVSSDGEVSPLHKYWSTPRSGEHPHPGSVEHLKDELETATRQHLVSDVPLGVFLSGGIDSSAITALAVRARGPGVKTFNISFDEAAYDESRFASDVARRLGTEHTEVRLSEATFKARLPDALASIDQPTFDAINTYFVSRAVREAGITVALAGTGGDELFGGYKSFVDIPRAARVAKLTAASPEPLLRKVAEKVARARLGPFGEVPPQTRWGKLGDVLATKGRLFSLYQTSYALFTEEFAGLLLAENLHLTNHGVPVARAAELERMIAGSPELHAISMLELSSFVEERLLRDTDAASMAVSLEVRVPLLDHVVVEAAAAVDPARRFEPLGKKMLLRELAMPNLDPTLFDRPKSGFVLPIDVWAKRELRGELDSTFADAELARSVGLDPTAVGRLWRAYQANAPGLYWSRVWALFVLLGWCRKHRVSM